MPDYHIDEDGVMRFTPGTWADQAADFVWGNTRQLQPGSGQMIKAEFNGTPMDGYETDHCAQVIHLRWHYERERIQARRR